MATTCRPAWAWGNLLLKDSDKDVKKQCETPLKKACDGKIARACSDLGSRCQTMVLLANKREARVSDKRESAELNEKACDLGDGIGCFNVAKDYEEGYGVIEDADKAKTLMTKAIGILPKECDGGDAASCFALGVLNDPTTKKRRIPADAPKAKNFYKKACDAGHDIACNMAKQ